MVMQPILATPTEEKITQTIHFSTPKFTTVDKYTNVSLVEATGKTMKQGSPLLPKISKTFELPWGSIITDFSYTHTQQQMEQLSSPVQPVPTYGLKDQKVVQHSSLNALVYSSDELFPGEWCICTTGAGLNADGQRVLFVTITMHPFQYQPASQIINSVDEITFSLSYQVEQQHLQPLTQNVQLMIIAPQEFVPALQELASHKNSLGVPTQIVDLESIYQTYTGRDKAEQIKTFIFNAVLATNVPNVLLVGDIKKLPIRHTDAYPWGDDFGGDILSDLYYADLFNDSYQFCTWDANNNDVFGELIFGQGFPQAMENIDEVDLYPDIHIGRLPCSTIDEVNLMVDKIRIYENVTADQNWFKKIILVGGDTFCLGQGSEPFVYEGEITNEKVAQQLPDFEKTFLWASKRNLNPLTFNLAMTQGAGFFSYAGHGFEHGWGTYRPNRLSTTLGLTQHVYYTPMIKGIKNDQRMPIMFFDACLTAKLDFNISDLIRYYPTFAPLLVALNILPSDPNEYLPCFAYSFLAKADGGAIATIGASRPAYTMVSSEGVYGGAGYLDVRFFKAYDEGVTVGEMMHQAQLDYINYVGKDFFTIEEYLLLGDPTLKVGGDPNGSPFYML